MTSFKIILRAAMFGVAIVAAAAAPTKQAQAADRGDVIAGVAGGLLLGTFFAAAANANSNNYNAVPVQSYQAPVQSYVAPQQTYQAPIARQRYIAPAQTYYAPVPQYYVPPVTFSIGIGSGRYIGHRRNFRGHRGHRHFRRGHGYRY